MYDLPRCNQSALVAQSVGAVNHAGPHGPEDSSGPEEAALLIQRSRTQGT